ncbi:tRNA pseudouridine synthase Pus10 [Frankliniella fusca]|uniref:tRNA pseudouridine synthase Pus10 n=1 Tax=Frankliniella fusca TaxID=407009 RepID=A0AAE1HNE1_9NEOP|nr:tRNA pseudouridine synthase Pus10 [Frankliniella fusca]
MRTAVISFLSYRVARRSRVWLTFSRALSSPPGISGGRYPAPPYSLLVSHLLSAMTVPAAHPLLLCVLLAALAAALPDPSPGNRPPAQKHPHLHALKERLEHLRMPHPHMPHLSPRLRADLVKVKNCVKAALVKLPGGVGHLMSNCLASIASGPPAFGACVAGKGIMSAARATSHIAVCVG